MMTGKGKWGPVVRGSLMTVFLLGFIACWTPDTSEGDYAVDWGEATATINDSKVPFDPAYGGFVAEVPVGDTMVTLVFDLADPEVPRITPCGEWVDQQTRICFCMAHPETGEKQGLCESDVIDPDIWTITAPDKNIFGTAGKAELVAGGYHKVTTLTSDLVNEGGFQVSRLSFEDVGLGINGQGGIWGVTAAAQQRLVFLEGEQGTANWGTSEDPETVSSFEGHLGIAVGFLSWSVGINMHYSRPFTLVKI